MNPNPEQPENQLQSAQPDIDGMLKKHGTLAKAYRALFEPHYGQIPVFAQGPTPEADKARFERIFRPWPKWVLRLGAELWHVDYPTIDRDIFFQTFRVVNVCLFRFPTDPKDVATAKHSSLEHIDFRVIALIWASFIGHAFEHLEASRKKPDAELAAGKISPQQHQERLKYASPEGLQNAIRENFSALYKFDGAEPFEITRAVETARNKTFDKHGRRKETPLIPVYRLMWNNWITIEKMSGPKELTHFLLPVLGDQDFYAANDRVKQICSRLGVRFKPPVK